MNYLFVHQNFPGQFRHVVPVLAADPNNRVVCIGEQPNLDGRPALHPATQVIGYPAPPAVSAQTHHYIRDYERAIRRGQNVARVALDLQKTGFRPDVVVVHPGWGEGLFLRDIYPSARHIHYCEFFYHGMGSDVGFDPEYPSSFDSTFKVRVKNSTQFISIDAADAGLSPTQWQRDQYPGYFQQRIRVIHDGINTEVVTPKADARLTIGDKSLGTADEVITYIARNLEPYRGYHVFMRALPEILKRRPKAQVVIVGGDEVSYGQQAKNGSTYREQLNQELAGQLDFNRIHWLGRVPYSRFLDVLRVSSVHVYLTYPFVLSWSLLESMSAGCLVVASATPPVQEVIRQGENGLLFDFFDRQTLSETVISALDTPQSYRQIRADARRTVVENYDLKSICLPASLGFISDCSR